MPNYRRAFVPGGTWFFTVNLLQRHHNDLMVREIDLLRETVRQVREKYPFQIDAWVVLPEHLHCVWTLPPGDCNFSQRWRLIKSGFSRALPKTERLSDVRKAAGERGIMATALLGAFDTRRFRLSTPYRLRTRKSLETWACQTCSGLALFHVSSLCRERDLSCKLVWRY
jgi:REP element-mobilizing transposase RayT